MEMLSVHLSCLVMQIWSAQEKAKTLKWWMFSLHIKIKQKVSGTVCYCVMADTDKQLAFTATFCKTSAIAKCAENYRLSLNMKSYTTKPYTTVLVHHVMIKRQKFKMPRSWKLIGITSAVVQAPSKLDGIISSVNGWGQNYQLLGNPHSADIFASKNVSKLSICTPWGLLWTFDGLIPVRWWHLSYECQILLEAHLSIKHTTVSALKALHTPGLTEGN